MTSYETLADIELFQRMNSGCEESFVALYRRLSPQVYRFALRMCGSTGIADEVTQEVFLLLLNGKATYDPARAPLGAWLLGVARNCALRVLDRDGRYLSVEDSVGEPVAEDNILAELTREESVESLRSAVLALPPRYREVVVLCDLEELSYQQAAAVLGCAMGTVRSRLHRARALLVDKLKVRVGT